ncbi:MAG: hypothetical protein P4L33_06620 [Capsulimonadaceae bacterium]|nr:hypothetical protein [Capsulimonadaceae bacterium]
MQRRVVLLKTDERAGLVADLAEVCRQKSVSLEISTGPGHVLLSFVADDDVNKAAKAALESITGVQSVHDYTVASLG